MFTTCCIHRQNFKKFRNVKFRNFFGAGSCALFAYRTSTHSTVRETPFYLLYGREARLPIDTIFAASNSDLTYSLPDYAARVAINLKKAHKLANELLSNVRYADRNPNARPAQYNIGDYVYLFTPDKLEGLSNKLRHRWHGPYRVVRQTSPVNYELQITDRKFHPIVHVSRLKLAHSRKEAPSASGEIASQ